MMYLFNNVYLTPDKTVPVRPEDDYGFVSTRLRSAINAENFFTRVYDVKFKAPLFAVDSYQDLIKTTFKGNEQKLFDLLLQKRDNRLIIMCNEEMMLKVAVRVLKAMLPNADVDTGFKVLKYMYLPFYYMHDSGLVSFVGPNDFQNIYTNLLAREGEVKSAWAKAKPLKLSPRQREKIQQQAGVELQTATYLANPEWAQAAEYKNKVVVFAKKSLMAMLVNDLRQKILDGFVDIQTITPEFNPLDEDVVQKLADSETFKFLVDPEFTPNNWEYVFATYDMSKLYALFQTYAPLRAFNLNDFSLLAKENDLTFEDVLAHELGTSCGRGLIGTDVNYKDAVNIYLLDLVFDLHKNDPAALKQFSLEPLSKG